MKKHSVFVLILFTLVVLTESAPARADSWQYEFAPYVFATNLNGTTSVGGVHVEVDKSFGDILEQLDSGLMGTVVASNGTWTILGDAFYSKLSEEETRSWQGPGGIGSLTGDLKVTLTQEIYQLAVGYRLARDATTLDVFAGGRYTGLENRFNLGATTGGLLPGGVSELRGSESWIEPVVGGRLMTPIMDNLSLLAYADYSLGSGDSNGGYQAIVGVTWQTGESWNTKIGYRYLSWDYRHNSSGYVWDMVMQGFYVGVGFQF